MSPEDTTPQGTFKLLYFATAYSYTKKHSEDLSAPLALSMLFDTLEERYPGIKANVLCSCAVTVNLDYVDLGIEDTTVAKNQGRASPSIIQVGDEVAIIPPVSSG
ncbi:MAG: hypothetical protein M1829_001030 [Trizodia sp. TS-e1964]|nr:MAG: hypothetical protein M1829_001030 [Trizodia sp. TS-e1964]